MDHSARKPRELQKRVPEERERLGVRPGSRVVSRVDEIQSSVDEAKRLLGMD